MNPKTEIGCKITTHKSSILLISFLSLHMLETNENNKKSNECNV
jgi:hypothetical protein